MDEFFIQNGSVLDDVKGDTLSHISKLTEVPYILNNSDFLHYHHVIELGICLDGEGVLFINGERQNYKCGDALIILPNQNHILFSTGKRFSVWKWVFINPSEVFGILLKQGVVPQEDVGYCGILAKENHAATIELLSLFIKEMCNLQDNRENVLILYYEVLLQKLAVGSSTPKYHIQMTELNPQITNIIEDIDKLLASGIFPSIQDLAAKYGYSYSYFHVFFQKHIGISPKKYIQNQAVRHAERLLIETDIPLESIAHKLGFGDVSCLYRTFLSFRGISPSKYRARWRNPSHASDNCL